MNNYAVETEMYAANYPSPEQQRAYMLQGAIATLVVFSSFFIAFAAS